MKVAGRRPVTLVVRQNMKFSSRTLCIAGLILWMGFGLVCPIWVGQGYLSDSVSNPTKWWKSGNFGLDGAGEWIFEAWYKMAPVWSPPEPRAFHAVVDPTNEVDAPIALA